MKKGNRQIFFAWIVMFCFIAGQVMIYAHRHQVKYNRHQVAGNQQTITEKCQLCDAMHHNSMMTATHQDFTQAIAADHFYKQHRYDFVSIALILSAGRAPPLS